MFLQIRLTTVTAVYLVVTIAVYIQGSNDEEEKKHQMEQLVADELARWDEDAMNSSSSDLGTAHGRAMSAASLSSRPATGRKVCVCSSYYKDHRVIKVIGIDLGEIAI